LQRGLNGGKRARETGAHLDENTDNHEADAKTPAPASKRGHLDVADLLNQAARVLREDFRRLGLIPHAATSGLSREEILRRFLNEHLPRRFSAASGFVVDAAHSVSRQTDIIVYDALNAPLYQTAFNSLIVGRDTVAATIEVKSRLTKSDLAKAIDDAIVIRSMTQQLRPLHRVVLNEGTRERVMEGDCLEPLSLVFAYKSDLSLASIARLWADIYPTSAFGTQLSGVVVLDKGVVHLSAWHPGLGLAERQLLPVLALPPLRLRDGQATSRVAFPRFDAGGVISGVQMGSPTTFPPGSKFFMTYEALGEDSLNWFFNTLLQYLSYYVRLSEPDIPHFSRPPSRLEVQPLAVCVELGGEGGGPPSGDAVLSRLKELLS
jgi:hypothetical protein